MPDFGLYVIGDEILSGKRRDRHFAGFREMLAEFGYELAWVQFLADAPELIITRLKASMNEGLPVFSCGGIGATPDDHTRACAAEAAGVSLVRHPEASRILQDKFGADAYPNRILMADLPVGAELIPNPYNQVPGFSINRHYFMPGFPDMAHPMGRWVLETHYADGAVAVAERSLRVFGVPESELMAIMGVLVTRYPGVKLFSLPRIGEEAFVELGFRGRSGVDEAFADLRGMVEDGGFEYSLEPA